MDLYRGSGGARRHPDEGAAFPDGGLTPRAAAARPSGVWGGN